MSRNGRQVSSARRMRAIGLVLAAVLCVLLPHQLGAQGQPRPPAAQDEFVPVGELPQDEALPAAPLLAGAYAIAWVLVLAYVWSLWRRLQQVERELREVAARIENRTGQGSVGQGSVRR